MKLSYRLGTFFGIGVDVHVTFLLLLGWFGLSTYSATGSWLEVVASALFVAVLFVFVVMHEYGHALTARRFGIRTKRITLYPIGGVASLEGMPRRPREQLLVALAGPAVNFVLAALIALAMLALGQPFELEADAGLASMVLPLLLSANLLMGAFNLLPALPMDGGRVLRALLEMRMGALRATEIAAKVARVLAIGMGLYALLGEGSNPVLLGIAVMVWFMAGVERRAARLQALREQQQYDGFALDGFGPFGFVPRARPPSRRGPRVVVEVVEGPNGPVGRYVRET